MEKGARGEIIKGIEKHHLTHIPPDWNKVTRLKDFSIKERIGKRIPPSGFSKWYGNSSAVYRAGLKSNPEFDFALKILYHYEPHVKDPQVISEQLGNQVLISKSLGCTNLDYTTALHSFVDDIHSVILPEWDAEEAENITLIMVLPLADRGNLHCYINEMALSKDSQYPYFDAKQVIFILTSLIRMADKLNNTYKVVHRDIKPDNIFLYSTEDNHSRFRLSIGDFGESWDAGRNRCDDLRLPYSSSSVSKGGAPFYLAPEILNARAGGVSVLDYSKNDIYAIGVVGLQLIFDIDLRTGPSRAEVTNEQIDRCRYSKKLVDFILCLVSPFHIRPSWELLRKQVEDLTDETKKLTRRGDEKYKRSRVAVVGHAGNLI